MKISQSQYKNIFAIRLETEKYVALVLPSEGGKIVSFQDKKRGKEYLLQNSSTEYLHVGLTDDFEKGECSGFDDMFPTIDPVQIDGKYYPDHGEVCRVPFSYEIKDDKLILSYKSLAIGYLYQKVLEEGEHGELCIAYQITNVSDFPLSSLWAGHCLIQIEQGGNIVVPFNEGDIIDCVYDSQRRLDTWERLQLKKEYITTLWTEKKRAIKWYFPEKCQYGFMGYQYPQGDVFMMEFDKNKLPYIGIWIDYGMVNGNVCVGLEPCTLGYDTVINAAQHHQTDVIEPKGIKTFKIKLYVRSEKYEY